MSRHLTPIDISNLPDLLRIAEEVRTTKKPRALKRDNETVAMLIPVATAIKRNGKRAKTKADYEAFRAAFGSWNDVDIEQFKADIYADRRRTTTRPPVKL